MSEVMPVDSVPHYGGEDEVSITCRLQDTDNFFGSAQNKRAPKLGQIGRSKRVVIEDDSVEDEMKPPAEKAPDGV